MNAEIIKTIFETQEQLHGYTNPAAVAEALERHANIPYDEAKYRISRMDTAQYVYPGAKETLESLIQKGDSVIAWTQGDEPSQRWKVRNAGLGELQQNSGDPPHTKRQERFMVMAHLDKISVLPEILETLQETGTSAIAIVDDKANNVAAVADVVMSHSQKASLPPIHPIWINQGRMKGIVPDGYDEKTFCQEFRTITDIRHLPLLREKLYLPPGSTWLIDVDHTLIHTAKAKENMYQQLARMVQK